jgi:heme/copper-type cytochrome/quinol oxidase subunit 3
MAQQIAPEERPLTRQEVIALKNKRTALTLFQISWILVFVCLGVVNLQIRSNFPSWPPEGVTSLDAILPTVATFGLILSAVTAYRGWVAMVNGSVAGLLRNWSWTLALGVAFIAVMAFEWVTVPFSGQYSTIFRVMTAFHAIHALAIGAFMLHVYRTAQAGGYSSRDPWMVEGAAKLWYFVVLAWLLFYVVLYLI